MRIEVANLRPDRHRRYPEELRRRILDWVDRATAAGRPVSECSKLIGVTTWRFTAWRRIEERLLKPKPELMALVPIETPVTTSMSGGLTLVTPSGHRVEGLEIAQVVALLRELA